MRNLHCVWFVLGVFSFSAQAAEEKSWESLLAKGDAAWVGLRRIHALPHPGLRLLAVAGEDVGEESAIAHAAQQQSFIVGVI